MLSPIHILCNSFPCRSVQNSTVSVTGRRTVASSFLSTGAPSTVPSSVGSRVFLYARPRFATLDKRPIVFCRPPQSSTQATFPASSSLLSLSSPLTRIYPTLQPYLPKCSPVFFAFSSPPPPLSPPASTPGTMPQPTLPARAALVPFNAAKAPPQYAASPFVWLMLTCKILPGRVALRQRHPRAHWHAPRRNHGSHRIQLQPDQQRRDYRPFLCAVCGLLHKQQCRKSLLILSWGGLTHTSIQGGFFSMGCAPLIL